MPRARAVGAVTGGAGMMAELDQVPLWPRGGRWGERRASDGADGRKRVFAFVPVWIELALQQATPSRRAGLSESHGHRTAKTKKYLI